MENHQISESTGTENYILLDHLHTLIDIIDLCKIDLYKMKTLKAVKLAWIIIINVFLW